MATLGELLVVVGANIDGFKGAMTQVNDIFGGIQKQADESFAGFDKLGGRLTKLAEEFTLVGIAAASFESAIKIEDAMSKIGRETGAAGEALEKLGETFTKVFPNAVQSAEDLAAGLGILAQRTGASGDELSSLLETYSKLAQVTGQQLGPAIDETQRLFVAWGVAVRDQATKLDELLAISQKAGIAFSSLAETMRASGATLRTMGLSFEDSAALMANFEAHGVNAQRVMMTLNQSLVTLSKEGFTDPQAALGALIQKIIDAKNPTEALSTATQEFKGRGLIPLYDALQQGVLNLDRFRDAIATAPGKIDSVVASTETFSESLSKLWHSVNLLLAPLGKDLLGIFQTLVDGPLGLKAAIKGFKELGDLFDPLLNGTYGLVAALEGLAEPFKILLNGTYGLNAAFKGISGLFPSWSKDTKEQEKNTIDLAQSLPLASKGTDALTASMTAYAKSLLDPNAKTLSITKAFEDLGVKVPPTAKELAKLTTAFNAIQSAYETGSVSLAAYSRAAEAFDAQIAKTEGKGGLDALAGALSIAEARLTTGKGTLAQYGAAMQNLVVASSSFQDAIEKQNAAIAGLNGAFLAIANSFPSVEASLKSFGKEATDNITANVTALQAKLEGAFSALEIGVPRSALAMQLAVHALRLELDKLNEEPGDLDKLQTAFENAMNAMQKGIEGWDPVFGWTGSIADAGKALKTFTDALPASKDGILKEAAAIAGLNTGFTLLIKNIPTTEGALKNLGLQTMPQLTKSADDARANFEAVTEAFRRNEATAYDVEVAWNRMHDAEMRLSNDRLDEARLGIPDLEALDHALGNATAAYENLASRGLLNVNTALEANIAQTRLAIEDAFQHGQSTTALQIKLEGLTDALKRQRDGWVDIGVVGKQMFADIGTAAKDIFTNISGLGDALKKVAQDFATIVFDPKVLHDIRNAINTDLTAALKDLITGVGNVGEAFKKLGTDILDIILNKIIALGIQKMLDLLAGVGGILGSIGTALGGIAGGVAGAAGTAAAIGTNTAAITTETAATTANTAAITALTGAIGGSAAGTAAGGAADAAGAAGGGVGGSAGASALSGWIGSISSAVSAVTGVISVFQSMHQETSLNAIELNTRITSILLGSIDATGKGYQDVDNVKVWTKQIGITTLENKAFFYDTLHPDLIRIETAVGKIGSPSTDALTAGLAGIGATIAATLSPIFNAAAASLKDIENFNWLTLHADLVGIWDGIGNVKNAVVALPSQFAAALAAAPVPIIKIILDGHELAQSYGVYLSQSGTVTPAAA